MTHEHADLPAPDPDAAPRWDAAFWDERYGSSAALWSGHVNAVVRDEVAGLPVGRALDVGCGEGGDALWLAEQGWEVVGVDVSRVALDRAAARARDTGLEARTTWEHRDLLEWTPPAEAFDLVSVAFVHLATEDRREVYARLAAAVAPGGTFLVAAHHPSDLGVVPRPPHPDLFFTAEELADDLRSGPGSWEVVTAEARPRPGHHPDGHPVTLHDTVLRARRRKETPMTPIQLELAHGAHNYDPLPVMVSHGEGAWVWDDEGRRYLDFLAAYSALNFGHRHPALVEAARRQLDRVTLTSRAFHHDLLGPFCAELASLAGKEMVLPMNTGAEAVETALKAARRWGYEVKGVPRDQATVIVMEGNFHGRTISIVSFSDDQTARSGYGPYTPGFRSVPYGDAAALAAAVDDSTVAVLLEPVQGEAGVIVPPEGYLADVRRLCDAHGLLMVADEIQSGLGRTGRTFGCDHDGVTPDMYVLGKALGGGIVPLSAVVADRDVLGVFTPGSHGSTFGGNPLAVAVGREVIRLLASGEPQRLAARHEPALRSALAPLVGHGLEAVRVRGLWAGVDLDPALGSGRHLCEAMASRGVLAKDTHGSSIRISPPLVISDADLAWGLEQLTASVDALSQARVSPGAPPPDFP
jgi:ornithine--oxo-acid transaminase